MNFASDNASGVHPAVLAAMTAANDGHVLGYGRDALTEAGIAIEDGPQGSTWSLK